MKNWQPPRRRRGHYLSPNGKLALKVIAFACTFVALGVLLGRYGL